MQTTLQRPVQEVSEVPEVINYIRTKFSLSLSDLEMEYLIKEVVSVTRANRVSRVPDEVVEDVKASYVKGMPTAVIQARYPQYGKSTIARFISQARKENNITHRN